MHAKGWDLPLVLAVAMQDGWQTGRGGGGVVYLGAIYYFVRVKLGGSKLRTTNPKIVLVFLCANA